MSKRSNQISVAEIINLEVSSEEIRKLFKDFQNLKAQIAKLPKEKVKAIKKELRGRIISLELLKLKDQLTPIFKEFQEILRVEFQKTVTKEKPEGHKSISLKLDNFNLAIINKSFKK